MDDFINKMANDMAKKLMQELNVEIPEYLKILLDIDKKSELIKYSKDIFIPQKDFAILAINSIKIGYIHQIKYHDFVPAHLKPTDKEIQGLSKSKAGKILNDDGKKFVTKISQIFKDRRFLVAHIFYNQEKWHLFYFDQRDIEEMRGNHWKEGSHVHFVNYLWPQYNINELWKIFDDAHAKIGSKLHIKYIPHKRYAGGNL